jgi:RNA polymerase sigma-70 factor (family 1)
LLHLKAGDHAAFNEIHHRYFAQLFRSAYNVLKDKDSCMDILQEIFVWFWEHRENHLMNSVKGYLLMAVKYQVANYIRNGKVREAFFDKIIPLKMDQVFNDDSIEIKELKAVIKELSSQLPRRCKEVFQLSREEYLNNKEIAVKMGISEKTVEAQLTKALTRLRTELGRINFWIFFL